MSFLQQRTGMQKYEKSRDTWRNRKVWPWSKKWSREKANRVLPREHTVHGKHPQVYIWTSPDGQYQNQIDYVLCSRRWGSSIQSAKTRPGADCGLDHELFIAKFRLKLKKVGGFMIWATVSSGSYFCLLYRAASSLAVKNIIHLISVLTIW